MESDYKSPFNPKRLMSNEQEFGGDPIPGKDLASQCMDDSKKSTKKEK